MPVSVARSSLKSSSAARLAVRIRPLAPMSRVAVAADSNIVRNRSSLPRSSATTESERWASSSGASSAGSSQGFATTKAATVRPRVASTRSVPKLIEEKSPLSRTEWPRASFSIPASRPWFTSTKVAAAAVPPRAVLRSLPLPIVVATDQAASPLIV